MIHIKHTEKENEKIAAIKEKKIEESTLPTPEYINDKRTQIAAWTLLILGLCMISTTFYMAIASQKNKQQAINNVANDDSNDENISSSLSVNRSDSLPKTIVENILPTNLSGCEEQHCRVTCTNATHFYTALYDTLNRSICPFTDILQIKEQTFFNGVIKNSWKEIELPIYEILLHDSSVKHIRSDAFNTLMFSSTFFLSWQNLGPDLQVGSGALLGLQSLRYLLIDTHIEQLDRAFFQPVQTSLMHLRLNCGLNVSNRNIFGISTLPNLEYVDLSHNNYNGGITKMTFASAPNLKYIRMIDANILYIDSDAFSNLTGKLTVLNLSENKLVYLDAIAIEQLLLASPNTRINFALNDLYCGCKMYAFAQIYVKYRSQFMDALFCRKPYYLYGYFLNEIDYVNCENDGSATASTTNDEATTTASSPFTQEDPDWYNSNEQQIFNDTLFEIRCLNTFDDDISNSKSKPSEIFASTSSKFDSKSIELGISNFFVDLSKQNVSADLWGQELQKNDLEIFKLQPRSYEFELYAYENSSVQVTVKDTIPEYIDINIIWFIDAKEPPNYDCMNYRNPYFVTNALQDNTTYTFCLTVQDTLIISPLDCLPFYVPPVAVSQEHIWISNHDKPMIFSVLFLIFLSSTIFGGLAAYFAIKYYPDLVECSENVLMVKKCEKTCYISAISEAEYLRNLPFKKQKQQPEKRDTLNTPLPEVPQSAAYGLPLNLSVKNLECLESLTCSKGSFASISTTLPDGLYETPEISVESDNLEKRDVSNANACSPCTPPPLPKRNSTYSNDPLGVLKSNEPRTKV